MRIYHDARSAERQMTVLILHAAFQENCVDIKLFNECSNLQPPISYHHPVIFYNLLWKKTCVILHNMNKIM